MTSRRLLKAAEAIREVVATAVLTEIRDPRVRNVTIISVEVLPDMKQAKVYVSVMGNETEQRLALHGLQSAAGFLQRRIADRIETRYTPRLEFALDSGLKNTLAISQILQRVLPKDTESDAETPVADASGSQTDDAPDSQATDH